MFFFFSKRDIQKSTNLIQIIYFKNIKSRHKCESGIKSEKKELYYAACLLLCCFMNITKLFVYKKNSLIIIYGFSYYKKNGLLVGKSKIKIKSIKARLTD